MDKVQELIEQEEYISAAPTAKIKAQESSSYMMILKDAWQITNGSKKGDEFLESRLNKITAFLQSRGAEIENNDWVGFDWTHEATEPQSAIRESIQTALNRALEEDADVINLGGDEANSHVMQRLNQKISEQQNILQERLSGYDIQINQHKEALKERIAGENAVMNASDGTIKLEFSRVYDPKSNGWKKDAYNIEYTYKMGKGVKKSVGELWSDRDRQIVPEFAAKDGSSKKNRG